MRAGILTFHRALNYGAVLQAFALKHAIASRDVWVDIIDYRNDYIEKIYKYPNFRSVSGLRGKGRYLRQAKAERKKRKRFDHFRENYLEIGSDQAYQKDDIARADTKYDRFVTGSDQVWNPKMHKLDGTYYLDFVSDPKKKVSYAASFGVEQIRQEYVPLYQKWLKEYSFCSVRERHGIKILEQQLELHGRVDIDPVFLLSREEWRAKLALRDSGKKYVLIYGYGLSETQQKMASICYEAGMSVCYVGNRRRDLLEVPCEFLADLGPREFAERIYGASYVITNSFHGTALSIVFHVPFAMEYLGEGMGKVNSRLQNIISAVELEDRVLNESTVGESLLMRDIDWNKVDSLVESMRKESLEYIARCIQ